MNDTMRRIKKAIVDPEIRKIKSSVLGYITAVYHEERRCDAVYFDSDGAQKKIKRLKVPQEGDGVFSPSLKTGDRIELTYRNRSSENMFISKVYRKEQSRDEFQVKQGQMLPFSTNLF